MTTAAPDPSSPASTDAHREFLNRYYGVSRHFYDLTRKYYLFGRDRALSGLADDMAWRTLVEIGPGTGRNLKKLHAARPDARLGGLEASDAMLEHARQRCPWAALEHGFAETADLESVLGSPPDRILFSYCLTMVGDPEGALANARASIAPGGQVVAVDFADLSGLPGFARSGLAGWLRTFHVEPDRMLRLLTQADQVELGPGRYYVIARFGRSRGGRAVREKSSLHSDGAVR